MIFFIVFAGDPGLSIPFELDATEVASRWGSLLRKTLISQSGIKETDRIYNFPHDKRSEESWIRAQLNSRLQTINTFEGISLPEFKSEISNSILHELHFRFEKYWRKIWAGERKLGNIPENIHQAYLDFNVLIHRYEDMLLTRREFPEGGRTTQRVVVTFANADLLNLHDADYEQFTTRVQYGQLFINYPHVGKTFWEMFCHNDQIADGMNIRPQRQYTPNMRIWFGHEDTQSDTDRKRKLFQNWFAENSTRFNKAGFTYGDPKNAVGFIPVARIETRFLQQNDPDSINERIAQSSGIKEVKF